MDDPISARYVWDVEALTQALAAHGRSQLRTPFRYLAYLMTAFAVSASIMIPLWLITETRLPESRTGACVALVVILIAWAFIFRSSQTNQLLRWQARWIFRSMPTKSQVIEWSFGPVESFARTENSSSSILWPLFIKVVEDREGFLMYQSVQLFQWVPGHAFASEAELKRFIELVRSRVANYVVRGECQFPAKPEPVGRDEI
jgi:hypothetical protein